MQSASGLDHRQLLINFKKSVELWFLMKRDCREDTINISEAISQIQLSVKYILTDGLLLQQNVSDYQKFVNDLNCLNLPALLSPAAENYTISSSAREDDLSLWIRFCLRNGALCACLQHLVADKELLESYYSNSAYLRNEKYATALFICLSSFELNQSSLISQIDSSLYTETLGRQLHKRSSSHPHFSISPKKNSVCKTEIKNSQSEVRWRNSSESFKNYDLISLDSIKMHSKPVISGRCKSLPNISQHILRTRQRSHTMSQPINILGKNVCSTKFLKGCYRESQNFVNCHYCAESASSDVTYKVSSSTISDLKSLIPIQLVKCDDIKIYFDQTQTQTESPTKGTIDYDSPVQSRGVSSMNLLSCISSNLFSPSNENITKDYNISNSAFSSSAPSDFVSAFLPQDGEKLKSRYANSMFDDIVEQVLDANISCSSTPPASQSIASFLQLATLSRNNTDLERENAHFKISEAIISIIEHIKSSRMEPETNYNKELNISSSNNGLGGPASGSEIMADLSEENVNSKNHRHYFGSKSTQNISDYIAYAEWGESHLEALSAEGVALSLIAKFRDKQLPCASDIKWLVSEEDAPQKLLPMPNNQSFDPDENFVPSFTRGTRDWAPPRQQIIFTDHTPPKLNRKKQMQKQNYRCAGCGMRVAAMYISRYRYCTYFGKYHCSGCHRNQISLIPAKVLERWDFTYYPVSVFAYRLLEQIWSYPLFYIPDLNPSLYTKIKSLYMAKLRRIQLKFVQDFIKTCRFSEKEKIYFDSIPSYWYMDSDKWALSDLVAAKNGSFQKILVNLIEKCEEHVFNCVLCTARGFICELCPRKQIIYPWQMKVKRCENCGSCYHQSCWRNIPDCVKCQRLRMREQRII